MSHTAIEKEKSNKKTAKIYIVEGKNKDMFVKLWTFLEHLRRNSKTQIFV